MTLKEFQNFTASSFSPPPSGPQTWPKPYWYPRLLPLSRLILQRQNRGEMMNRWTIMTGAPFLYITPNVFNAHIMPE